jgi:hypothetical protein
MHGLPASASEISDVPAGPGTLRGRVVHRGRDGAGAGLSVALFALGADGRPGVRRTQSGPDGAFVFEKISNDPETVYLLGVRYAGVAFSRRTAFAAGETDRSNDIEIYDARAASDGLEFGAAQLRIDRGCSGVRVHEVHALHNPTDFVLFVPESERGDHPPIARVPLPENAVFFEAIGSTLEESIDVLEDEVLFWGPIHPGAAWLRFAYSLPSQAGRVDAVRVFPVGASDVEMLTFGDTPSPTGAALHPADPVTFEERTYAAVASGPVAAGGEIAFSLDLADFEPGAMPVETRSATLWLELDDAALEVRERLEFEVAGDEPLRAETDAPLLCLPLPAGVEEMKFSNEAFALGIQPDPTGGLALRGPLPAGRSGFSMNYLLRSGDDTFRFERTFPSGLALLSMYVADTGLLTETDRLHRRRPVRTSDRTYIHLEAFEVDPGETIAVDLTSQPLARPLPRPAATGFVLISALFAGLFLTAPLRKPPEPGAAAEPIPATAAEREAVYVAIRDLEDDFETGKVSAEDHRKMLAELRQQAGELLRAERAASAATEATLDAVPPAATACVGCGASVPPEARFCSQCGRKLGDAAGGGEPTG